MNSETRIRPRNWRTGNGIRRRVGSTNTRGSTSVIVRPRTVSRHRPAASTFLTHCTSEPYVNATIQSLPSLNTLSGVRYVRPVRRPSYPTIPKPGSQPAKSREIGLNAKVVNGRRKRILGGGGMGDSLHLCGIRPTDPAAKSVYGLGAESLAGGSRRLRRGE